MALTTTQPQHCTTARTPAREYGTVTSLLERIHRSGMAAPRTRKVDAESLSATNLLPTLSKSGIPVYQTGVRQFQVAAFESRDFVVYTVSDLSHQKNHDVLVALAPAVQHLLNQMDA